MKAPYIIAISLCACVLGCSTPGGKLTPEPFPAPPADAGWEYKVLSIDAPGHEKTGANALASNQISVDEPTLNALGKAHWELVSSYLEPETSFPNLGDMKYVTGIHSNVRPMRVVLLFKRPAK